MLGSMQIKPTYFCDSTAGAGLTGPYPAPQTPLCPPKETLTCVLEDGPNAGLMAFASPTGPRVCSKVVGAFTLLVTHHNTLELYSMDINGSEVKIGQDSLGYFSLTLDLNTPSVGILDPQGEFRLECVTVLRFFDGSRRLTLMPKFAVPMMLYGSFHGKSIQGKMTGTLPEESSLLGKCTLTTNLVCSTIRWTHLDLDLTRDSTLDVSHPINSV